MWEGRSEEHTSELQSLRHLVCRLLLEKKKKKGQSHHIESGDAVVITHRREWRAACVLWTLCKRLSLPLHRRSSTNYFLFFFFNDPAPPEIYPLSLHDALPI